jgi:hypothetical protein
LYVRVLRVFLAVSSEVQSVKESTTETRRTDDGLRCKYKE